MQVVSFKFSAWSLLTLYTSKYRSCKKGLRCPFSEDVIHENYSFYHKNKISCSQHQRKNRHGKINEEILLNFTSPIANSNPKAWPNPAWSNCNFCLLQGNAGYNSEKWESLKRRYIFHCFLISIGHFCWIGKRMSHWSKGKWKKTACYGKFSAAEIFHVYAVSAVPCHYCVVL